MTCCIVASPPAARAVCLLRGTAFALAFGGSMMVVPVRAAQPSIVISNLNVLPGQNLNVGVACPTGTGAADLRSPVTPYTVLDLGTDGLWRARARVFVHAKAAAYRLIARCTGPGSPYDASTATFRVGALTPERWVAESRTAVSITGDAAFTPTAITFAGGARLPLRYIRDVPGTVAFVPDRGARVRAQLYGVHSTDLRLLYGNRLCGERPTFISVLRRGARPQREVMLSIYYGAAEPNGTERDKLCAGYGYSIKD